MSETMTNALAAAQERPLAVAVGAAAALAAAMWAARVRRRANEPRCTSRFRCACGKVSGKIEGISEDATRLRCCCESCKLFARWAEKQGLAKGFSFSAIDEKTDSVAVLMTTKSNVTVESGLDLLKLCHRAPGAITCRFYASCCGTPVFNTFHSLGFISVIGVCVEDAAAFGDVETFNFIKEATVPIELSSKQTLMTVGDFFRTCLRFVPDTRAGPALDYSQDPVYIEE